MHEYFTSYIKPSYGECVDCKKRTTHICLKCSYCYSCHFKIENIEKENISKKRALIAKYDRYHGDILEQKYPVTFVTYKIKKPTKTTRNNEDQL
jgi:hypothetical protein